MGNDDIAKSHRHPKVGMTNNASKTSKHAPIAQKDFKKQQIIKTEPHDNNFQINKPGILQSTLHIWHDEPKANIQHIMLLWTKIIFELK